MRSLLTQASLALALFSLLDPAAGAASKRSASRWWSPGQGHVVTIEGADGQHEFDFESDGTIDGPWGHNGEFQVRRNCRSTQSFEVRAHVGTDAGQTNDFDIVLRIDSGGKASLTGRVFGAPLAAAASSVTVRGRGTESRPYRLAFRKDSGEVLVIRRWTEFSRGSLRQSGSSARDSG